jgi:hypothetical protein
MRAKTALRNERAPSGDRREPPAPIRGLKIGSSSSRAISVTGFPLSYPLVALEKAQSSIFRHHKSTV